MATELAFITLKPGVDLDGSTPEAQAWQESISIVVAQEGFQRCYYGQQLEDPSILLFVIDWEGKECHEKFIAAPSFGPFKQKLASLMEGVHLHHIVPPNTKPLGLWPVTEVATLHAAQPHMVSNVQKFAAKLEEGKPEGLRGVIYGKVMEKIVRHKDVGTDVEAQDAVVVFIGWNSKEAHMKFRDTELFKEAVPLLREGNGGVEMFHVPFKAAASVID